MPPSTIVLDNIVVVLRRSPATVEHQDRHHAVVLTELSLEALLDREFVGRHRAERVQITQVSYVRYLDRSIVKPYDYINRVVITLPFMVYEGTWTTLSPLVAMHHHDLACA